MSKGDIIWSIVLVIVVAIGILLIVLTIKDGNARAQRYTDCETAGYVGMVKIGAVYVCVGVLPDGEYVAVPLETVRSRLGE